MVFSLNRTSGVYEYENAIFYDNRIQEECFVDISRHFLSDIFLTKANSYGQEINEKDNGNSDSDIDSYESERVYTLADEKNFSYKCVKCDVEFTDEKSVAEHIDWHKREPQKFLCGDCDTECDSKGSLRRHARLVHNKKRKQVFVCRYCYKVLSSVSSLNVHVARHTGHKRFECDTCNKMFATKGSLQSHMAIHLPNKPFRCSLCDKTFSSRQGFQYHNNLHAKGGFNSENLWTAYVDNSYLHCTICNKRYKSLKSLLRHSEFHKEPKNCSREIDSTDA